MKKTEKLFLLCIISISVVFTPWSFILIQKEVTFVSNSNSNNDKNNKELESEIEIKGVRLTFINNFKDSIVISWFTEIKANNPNLKYSLKSNLSDAIIIKPNLTETSISTYIYDAELINLTSNKTYYYQISSDENENNKREIMNFTTLTNKSAKSIKFLIYGDSRTQREERKELSKKIMSSFINDFDFYVHLGDIVASGRDQDQWNDYFCDVEGLSAFKQGIYVEGNHEGGLKTKMYDNLPMTSSESTRYYSFSYGGVGFVILNSNRYIVGDDDQTDWLNQTLIRLSQENTFNFAFMHHPLLHNRSISYHREKWRPLFDKYNISCIFAAHNHHYERSYPITNCITMEFNNSEQYDYVNIDDPMYFVSGGAGAPLYPPYDYSFIAKNQKEYHFLLIDVKKEPLTSTVSLEAWAMPNDFGSLFLFDNITITKNIVP